MPAAVTLRDTVSNHLETIWVGFKVIQPIYPAEVFNHMFNRLLEDAVIRYIGSDNVSLDLVVDITQQGRAYL